jgi:hypothetical protein
MQNYNHLSTLSAIHSMLLTAWHKPNTDILVINPKKQDEELFMHFLLQEKDSVPDWCQPATVLHRTKNALDFDNGSMIKLALQAGHLRGLRVNIAYLHESLRHNSELLMHVLPLLSLSGSKSSLILFS